MIRIGIDPAVAKQTAVAVTYPNHLALFLVDTFDPTDLLLKLDALDLPDLPIILTIEAQKIYRGSRVKTQTILELANRGGYFEGLLCSYFRYSQLEIKRPLPQEWKGQVPADMYRKRIMRKHPQVAKALTGYNRQEQEDLAHAYGLVIF